ncbi:MAG: hypothetical protein U1G07_22760 [Verrucomicrobiota bacterium]
MTGSTWSPRADLPAGRINAVTNTFANANEDNPRILAIAALSADDQAKLITSIDFSWTGSGASSPRLSSA